jgi:hypothetical protein
MAALLALVIQVVPAFPRCQAFLASVISLSEPGEQYLLWSREIRSCSTRQDGILRKDDAANNDVLEHPQVVPSSVRGRRIVHLRQRVQSATEPAKALMSTGRRIPGTSPVPVYCQNVHR